MLNMFRRLRIEGESVVRRSVWFWAAAVLLLGAAGLAAAASSIALAEAVSLPLALLLSSAGLFGAALGCFVLGNSGFASASPVVATAAPVGGFAPLGIASLLGRMDMGLIDQASQLVLLRRLQRNPGTMLALAAAAGLAIAAIDHFADGGDSKPAAE